MTDFSAKDLDDATALITNDQANTDSLTGNVIDDDLVKLTLSQLPSTLTDGTFTLAASDPSAVRFFDKDGHALTSLSVNLANPTGYLAGITTGDVDVWMEGLHKDSDLIIKTGYTDPEGNEIARDTVHMLLAEWNFVDQQGNALTWAHDLPEAQLAFLAGGNPKNPLPENLSAFRDKIDGLSTSELESLRVVSGDNPDDYYDDTFSTSATAVLSAMPAVFYWTDDANDPVTSSDRDRFAQTLGLNIIHNAEPPKITLTTQRDSDTRVGPNPEAVPSMTADESASATSATAVNLVWNGGILAKSFRIEQLGEDGLAWNPIGTQNAGQPRTFTVTGLNGGDGHIYSWRIVSVNEAGETVGNPIRGITKYNLANVDLSNKERAFSLLMAEENRHRGHIYYQPAHVDRLFDQLSSALNWITKVVVDSTLKQPKYSKITHKMTLTGGVSDAPIDVTH